MKRGNRRAFYAGRNAYTKNTTERETMRYTTPWLYIAREYGWRRKRKININSSWRMRPKTFPLHRV